MRKEYFPVIITFLLLFAATGKAMSEGEIVRNNLTSEGKKRVYYLFAPKSALQAKSAPLLVLLHGSGRDGRILIEHWQKLAEQEGIILAGPNALDSRSWSIPNDGPKFIHDLV